MDAKMNVVGYRNSFSERPSHVFDFEALSKVLKRRRCLFQRKTTYLYQALRLCKGLFQNTKNKDHYDIFTYVFPRYSLLSLLPCLYTCSRCI